ncbi:DUF1398 domain-containing protein [Pararhizobium mangrovi]|uniref:DUF1398 domain-containing protein n=1 Tax=Pararhizobium mangrovi TaxID=2590452 RepID=A0A506U2Y0_9HYPH|nr:DUF1398 family protein [Pararhizobium mangrovi]TPW28722.1 DUF1398 domain-containing protein [Pararhizobium mangrovi]
MDQSQKDAAEKCLRGAEDNSMTFPEIVGTLMQEGFESYAIDFRRASAVYYRPDGDSVAVSTHRPAVSVAANFDTTIIQGAIREAQQLVPGYSYAGFCKTIMEAGCAGYIVSFSGRRAVYFGRSAETHVEHLPQ